MKYYFEDLEKQKQLKVILDEWLGTPFRHKCGVKKVGTDCIHFVARSLEEMGVLKWRKDLFPDYPKDWNLHNTRELLAEGIEKNLKVEKFTDFKSPMNGDLVLSHYGKAASHAGLYFDGYVYQALSYAGGVCKINFNNGIFKRQMRFLYRVLA